MGGMPEHGPSDPYENPGPTMTLQSLCNKKCDVETFTYTQSAGARKRTASQLYVGLPCRLRPSTADDAKIFRRDSMEITHVLYIISFGAQLVTGITITQNERVRFPSGGTRLFTVQGVRNPDEQYRFLTLGLKELKA